MNHGTLQSRSPNGARSQVEDQETMTSAIDGLIHRLTQKNCNILFYGGFMLGWV